MKYSMHTCCFHRFDEAGACLEIRKQQLVHVRIVAAVFGNTGANDGARLGMRRGPRLVRIPDSQPASGDILGRIQLR